MRSLLSATALTALCLIMTGCSITMEGTCDSYLPDGNAAVCQSRSDGLLERIFGKARDNTACDSACDAACDTDCDTACDAACDTDGDTACDAACDTDGDTACDAACDDACDAACKTSPFAGIFGRHQVGNGQIFGKLIAKPTACDDPCDASCDDGCADACDAACDTDGDTACDAACDNGQCDSAVGGSLLDKCRAELFGPRRCKPCDTDCDTACDTACDTDGDTACDDACDNGQCDSAVCGSLLDKCRAELFGQRRCKPVTMNFCSNDCDSNGCDNACDSDACDSACDSDACDSACDSNGKGGLFGSRCGKASCFGNLCGKGGKGCFAGFLSGQGNGSCCGNSWSNGGSRSLASACCGCGSPKCSGRGGRGNGSCGGCGLLNCRSCMALLHGGRHGLGLLGGGLHPYGGEIPHTANPAGMYGLQGGNPAPTYAYPYYTVRGPRDFLTDGCGPPPIAPYNPRTPLCLPSIGW